MYQFGFPVLAVICVAKKVIYVCGCVDGRGVEDGLLPWFVHHLRLDHVFGAPYGVDDGQRTVLTVADQLEGFPQHKRASHHAQHRL